MDVKSTNVEYSEGEGFVLTYNIDAGKRYKFNKIFANISETLGKKTKINIEFSKSIPLIKTGKQATVISTLPIEFQEIRDYS